MLAATPVFADESVKSNTKVSVGIASTCSMSSTTSSAHTATIPSGTLQSDIGKTSIKTVCNDSYGFQIKAVGYNVYSGTEGDTNLVSSSVFGASGIATGTATSGDASAWAMKVSAVSGTYTPTIDYAGDYDVIPSVRTKVASFASAATGSEGATIETTYRVYASPTQAAGTYTGGVKYTLFHPDSASGGLSSITYLQDMSSTICENTNPYEVVNLIDRRDGKSYDVARLADGNCWMVENLRYGGVDASGTVQTNTSSDTDLPSGTTFSLTTSTPTGSAYETSTSWQGKYDASEYYPDDTMTGTQYWGYLYNWYSAVAGTVSGQVSREATGSICPRGWTLPTNSIDTDSKSYSNLLWRSGVIANIADNSAYATGGFNILTSAPMNFLRAGWHSQSGTGVAHHGDEGVYRSSSSSSTTIAYSLVFGSNSVHPRNDSFYAKAYGFSVRCVAR